MHWLCAQHGRQVRVAGVDASTAHRVVVKVVVDEAAVDADREAPAIVAGVADGLVRGTAERPTRLTLVVLEVERLHRPSQWRWGPCAWTLSMFNSGVKPKTELPVGGFLKPERALAER